MLNSAMTITRTPIIRFVSISILFAAAMLSGRIDRAAAFMAPMGPPIPTTVVLVKPAPGEIFGNKTPVSFGVKGKTYRFVLKDGWVDDPQHIIHWDDVWQQVRQYTPNFNVAGIDDDTFEKIQPGQTVTVRGMYSPMNQTYEVVGVDSSGGPFQPPAHF
jgi:hypothetical protein